jgi:hypothetical protein
MYMYVMIPIREDGNSLFAFSFVDVPTAAVYLYKIYNLRPHSEPFSVLGL